MRSDFGRAIKWASAVFASLILMFSEVFFLVFLKVFTWSLILCAASIAVLRANS